MVGSRRLYDGKSLHLALTQWNNPAGDLLMPWLQRYLHISVRREGRPLKWRVTVPLRREKTGRVALLLRLTIYGRQAAEAAPASAPDARLTSFSGSPVRRRPTPD